MNVTNAANMVWDGKSWQEWVNKLLKMRHAENYRILTDKDRGDGGLEGFTTCGKAYQCYCPELCSTAKWKEHVQRKIRDDLAKLQNNTELLAGLLGGVTLKSWHLVVPEDLSKDLTQYCNGKATECRAWNLPILSGDFLVTLETDANWPAESHALQHARAARIDFKIPLATTTDLSQWQVDNINHFGNVKRKCIVLSGGIEQDAKKIEQGIIGCYIEGQNALETIAQRYPDVYETLIDIKNQKERYLFERTSGVNSKAAMTILNEAIADMRAAIKSEMPNASDRVIDSITREATSDWIIRCPLDFKETSP